jgi:hypothetical protein
MVLESHSYTAPGSPTWPRLSDTTPEVERLRIELLKQMTGEQRVAIAFKLTNFTRRAAVSRIRAEHPDWTDAQVKRELLRIAFLPHPLPEGLPW